MNTSAQFTVTLMGVKKVWTVEFDNHNCSVFNEQGFLVDGGVFGYKGCIYWTERTREVELFYEALEQKAEKAMKTQKEAYKSMIKCQHERAWK